MSRCRPRSSPYSKLPFPHVIRNIKGAPVIRDHQTCTSVSLISPLLLAHNLYLLHASFTDGWRGRMARASQDCSTAPPQRRASVLPRGIREASAPHQRVTAPGTDAASLDARIRGTEVGHAGGARGTGGRGL